METTTTDPPKPSESGATDVQPSLGNASSAATSTMHIPPLAPVAMDMAEQHLGTLLDSKDAERGTLIKVLLTELWPFASNIAQAVLVENVQPALLAALPRNLPEPRFTRVELGDEVPDIENVIVDQRKYGEDDEAVVIEADVVYNGKPKIEMALGDIGFGVDEASLKGRVEVLLRPLLDRIPLIGASQVAFINRPVIDYNLTGVAKFGNQSVIRGLMRSVVDDVLAQQAVLPNRVALKLAPETDYFHISAQPLGVLRVAALKGKHFPSTDRNAFKQAVGLSEEPDVYLKLVHGSRVVYTARVDDSANPVWKNNLFDFVQTSASPAQQLQVEAYDYDLGIGNDDFLGRGSVFVSDLIRSGVHTIHLEDSPENARPTVKLAARWLPLSSNLRHVQHAIMTQRSDTVRPKSCSSLLLIVEVDEAHNLPGGKRPYVRVRVGDQSVSTAPAYDVPGFLTVRDPEFEQTFHILLQKAVDASVRVEFHVLDLYSREVLGHAFSSLAEAVEAGPSGKVYEFALMGAQNAEASLRVRLRLAAIVDEPPLWKALADGQTALARTPVSATTPAL